MAFSDTSNNRSSRSTYKLCDKCEHLKFDDLKLGGFAGKAADGTPRLRFDDSDPPCTREFPSLDIEEPEWREDSLPDLPALKASADAGCELCGFLRRSISNAKLGVTGDFRFFARYLWGRDAEAAEIMLSEGQGLTDFCICMFSDQLQTDLGYLVFDVCRSPCHDDPDGAAIGDWLGLRILEDPHALSERNVRFIQSSLADCERTCHHPEELASPVPTRLVDLGPDERTIPCLRANAREELTGPNPIKYAALSYCWGAADQPKTTSTNIEERKRGIPVESMSRVMQDAVAVCRALSIRYLWIDSLCIIQGNHIDWAHESEAMGLVYSGAYITICAAASSSSDQGFLHRDAGNTFRMGYNSTIVPSIAGEYILVDIGHVNNVRSTTYCPIFDDIGNSTWGNRAWTFQEEQMSTRCLVFGKRMLHFQCGTLKLSENGYQRRSIAPETWAEFMRTAAAKRTATSLRRHFIGKASTYANMALTFESDRLPAISGLARQVQEVTGDQYLAGLWRGDLQHGLVWYMAGIRQSHSSREACLSWCGGNSRKFPTWTWAARSNYFQTLCLANTESGHLRSEWDQIDARVSLDGPNAFGGVKGGEITATAASRPLPPRLVKQYRNGTAWTYLWPGPTYVARVILDWDSNRAGSEPSDGLVMILISSECVRRREEEEEEEEEEEDWRDEPDWSKTCRDCKQESRNRDAFGLILHSAKSESGKNCYYRVGVFESRVIEGGGLHIFADCEKRRVVMI